MVTQGNDINEAVALITAGNAINQDPEKVGNGLRTIALRMAGTEEAKKELEESGEEVTDYIVDGVVGTKSKIDAQLREFTAVASNNFQGVSMVDARGNYKDTYEVMQDIADIYDEIEETDKKFGTNHLQALLELLAGKNRANIAASILQNGDMLRDVYEQSQDSEGSAMEENEKYLDSLEGKMQKIKNNLQDLAFSLLNSDLLKIGLDVIDGLLDGVNTLIDAIGGIPVAMGAAFGAFKFVDWLKGGSKKAIMEEQGKYIQGIFDYMTGQDVDASLTDTATEQGLAESKTEVATASQSESAAIGETIAMKNREIATNEELAQSNRNLSNSENAEIASDTADNVDDALDTADNMAEGKPVKVKPEADVDTSDVTKALDEAGEEVGEAGTKAMQEGAENIASDAGGDLIADAMENATKGAGEAGSEAIKGVAENITSEAGDEVNEGLQLLADNIMDAGSEAVGDAIGEAIEGGAKAGEEAVSKSSGLFAGIGEKIATFMSTSLGTALAFAIPAALVAGVAAYNHYKTQDFNRKFNTSTDSATQYAQTVQDLDNVNSKISETNEQIRQIEAIPNKSITDEADLARLERENVALERQKALLEANEKTQKQQQHTDAISALGSDVVKSGVKDSNRLNTGSYTFEKTNTKRGKLTDIAKDEIKEWTRLQDEIAKKQDEFMGMSEKDRTSSRGKALQQQIKDDQKALKELDNNYISSHISQLTDLQSRLDTTTSEGLKQYNDIEGIIKDYNEYGLSKEEKAVSALDSYFGKSTDENVSAIGKELKKSIIDQLSSGEAKTAQEALMNLGLTLDSIGENVDASALEDYFGKITAGAKQAEESLRGVDGSFAGVKSAFETANQGADYDEMVNFLKTAKELRKEGQIGTDDFQTIAQWMSPKEIKGGAKAYKEAYDKYIKKVNSWFGATDKDGNIDTKKGMNNFADSLVGAGKATKKGGLDTLKLNFDNTAEAAKKLGVGVGVVDTALHKLEEYGVDLSGINFSSEMFNEYSDSLDALKNTYNAMNEGEAKESLGEKIFGKNGKGGFQKDLEYYQDHMDKLTEDKIVKIKLEVDSAQLESEIEELRGGGRSLTREERGAVISKEVSLRSNREKTSGINRKNNKDYASSFDQIDQIHKLMNDENASDKDIERYQKYEDAIVSLQNKWLGLREEGKKLDWGEFIQSQDAEKELEKLGSLSEGGMQKVLDALGLESSKVMSQANQDRIAFAKKNASYRWSHQEEAESIAQGLRDEGYKNAGVNERGKAVKDVEESNERIKKSTQNLFNELSKGKDVYGELEKEAKRQNIVSDEQGSAVEKLAEKYHITGEQLQKFKEYEENLNLQEQLSGMESVGEVEVKVKADAEEAEKKINELGSGEKLEIKAKVKVDGKTAEQEIQAIKDEGGEIHYYANVNGVITELEPQLQKDGTVTYVPKTDDLPEELPEVEQPVKREVDNSETEKKPEEVEQPVKRKVVDESDTKKKPKKEKQTVTQNYVTGKQEQAKTSDTFVNYKLGVQAPPVPKDTKVNYKLGSQASPESKSATVNYTASASDQLKSWKPPEKHAKVIYDKIAGTAHIGGTAFASGRAYAKGTLSDEQASRIVRSDSWKTNRAETALTGEVGQELVVDTKGNSWFTVGDNGAEFARIPKGAVVFNAEQTEQLFKKGYINSRGRSNGKVKYPSSSATFATGTAYKSGRAYKRGSKDSKTFADKISAYTSQLFDWAELRLKRLTNLTEKYNKMATRATKLSEKQYKTNLATYKTKNSKGKTVTRTVKSTNWGMQEALDATINATRNEIIGADKASKSYLSASKKVAKKAKLKGSLRKQVKKDTINGTFNIKHYKKATKNKATLEAIQAYNTWYEKYLDTQNSIAELESKMRDYYQKRLDNIKNWYASLEGMNKALNDRDEALRKYQNTIGVANPLSEDSYKDSIKRATENVSNALKAYNQYSAEINRQLNKGLMRKNDSSWISAQTELAKLSQEYNTARQTLEDLNNTVRSLEFDNLKNNIDVLSKSIEKLSTQLDLMKSFGWRSGIGYTEEQQLSNAQTQLNLAKEQIPSWQSYRTEALADMSKYAFGTEAWKKAKERFDDANSSILDISSSIVELISSIREVRWKAFDDGIATLENTSTELENIRDLLNEDYFNDENGNLTEDGLANIALLTKLMENAQRKVVAYNQALVDLEDDYKNGNIAEEEYISTKRDYIKATQEQSESEQDYMKEIVSAYTKHIEEQNNALQNNIDKRKEALSRVKDYYDYQRTISEKSKDINYLQSQIRALEGVSNKAGQAKLASLRDQLAEAQLDMNDVVYNHEYDLRTQGYDEILDALDESLDKIEEQIAQSTEYQKQVVSEAMALVASKSEEISTFIIDKLNADGVRISEETETSISAIGNVSASLQNLGDTVRDLPTETDELVKSLTGIGDIDTSPIDDSMDKIQKWINLAGSVADDKTEKPKDIAPTPTPKPTTPTTPTKNINAVASVVSGYFVAGKTTGAVGKTAKQRKRAEDFIAKKKQKASKKKSNYSAVNQKIYDKTKGYVLNADNLKALAKKLGITYDNGKKSGKLYKMLDSIGYFAKGSENIIKDMLGITQEQGQEIIYRKSDGAMLTPLGKGDKVFSAQMTDNLWAIAKNASLNNNGLSGLSTPIINNVNTNSPVVNINFENFMTVEGNVDKEAITDIRKFKAEMVDEFTKTMTNEMNLLGHKFRF